MKQQLNPKRTNKKYNWTLGYINKNHVTVEKELETEMITLFTNHFLDKQNARIVLLACLQRTVAYVNNCNDCKNKNRKPHSNIDNLGNTTSTFYKPLTRWSMDVVSFKWAHGPNGFCKLLTLMDYKTRWLEAFPMINDRASSIIRILRNQFVPRYR